MVRDLEDTLADWPHQLETAPDDGLKTALQQLLESIVKRAITLTEGGESGFWQLVEQARAEQRQAEDWAVQRDRQERQNWLRDYE
jgi:hypothetical protein